MDYHAPKLDGKIKAKMFYAVTAKGISGTFDNKDMACRAALRAKDAGLENVKIWAAKIEKWEGFVPETKGDKEFWEKFNVEA